MTRYPDLKTIRSDPCDHPASRAWSRCTSDSNQPWAIEVLKEQRSDNHKSAVYRLMGLPTVDAAVIAKRCLHRTLRIESLVFEQILPFSSLSYLRSYGCWVEPDSDFGWIFLEDAGEQPYLSHIGEHRQLVTIWIAELHVFAMKLDVVQDLPKRGLSHYYHHLTSGRHNIQSCMDNPALTTDDIETLRSILSYLDLVDACWERMRRVVCHAPLTLVHSDLKPKNIRLRNSSSGHEILIFDWGEAGYGFPAVDLVYLDFATYHDIIRTKWSSLTADRLRELRDFGILVTSIVAIDWESRRLEYQWVDRAMSHMTIYERRLAKLIDSFTGIS